jgi:hypothetical protein
MLVIPKASSARPLWFVSQQPDSVLQLQKDSALFGFFFLRWPKIGRK